MILQISDDENIKVKIANNFLKKLIGFMGKKDFDYGIIFPKTNSIHTFFMKENIDVIGFDNHGIIIFKAVNVEKNKVIVIKEQLKNIEDLILKNEGRSQNTDYQYLSIKDKSFSLKSIFLLSKRILEEKELGKETGKLRYFYK